MGSGQVNRVGVLTQRSLGRPKTYLPITRFEQEHCKEPMTNFSTKQVIFSLPMKGSQHFSVLGLVFDV